MPPSLRPRTPRNSGLVAEITLISSVSPSSIDNEGYRSRAFDLLAPQIEWIDRRHGQARLRRFKLESPRTTLSRHGLITLQGSDAGSAARKTARFGGEIRRGPACGCPSARRH